MLEHSIRRKYHQGIVSIFGITTFCVIHAALHHIPSIKPPTTKDQPTTMRSCVEGLIAFSGKCEAPVMRCRGRDGALDAQAHFRLNVTPLCLHSLVRSEDSIRLQRSSNVVTAYSVIFASSTISYRTAIPGLPILHV